MWRVNFIEREAWFVNLWTSVRRDLFADVCVTLNFSFISLKPQDFHETLCIRREIWSFPFYLYYAWIFLHFVRGDLLPPAHAILLAFILLRPFWFVWRTDQVVYFWSSLEVCDELFSFWIIKPSIEYLIFFISDQQRRQVRKNSSAHRHSLKTI